MFSESIGFNKYTDNKTVSAQQVLRQNKTSSPAINASNSAIAFGTDSHAILINEEHFHSHYYPLQKKTLPTCISNIPGICQTFQPRSIVETLSASFKSNKIRYIALTGIGGSGKTELAKHLVNKYKEIHHKDEKLFLSWWIDASTDENLKMSWEALGEECVELPYDKAETSADYLKRINHSILEQLRLRSDWILVFDDVQSLNQIEKFLPNQADLNGIIIITSQHKDIIIETRCDLSEGLTESEAISMAYKIYCREKNNQYNLMPPISDISPDQFKTFVNYLGRLPLAISVATIHFSSLLSKRMVTTPIQYVNQYIIITNESQYAHNEIMHKEIAKKQKFYKNIQENVIYQALVQIEKPLLNLIFVCILLGGKGIKQDIFIKFLYFQLTREMMDKNNLEHTTSNASKIVKEYPELESTAKKQLEMLLHTEKNYSLLQYDMTSNTFYLHNVTYQQALLLASQSKEAKETLREVAANTGCILYSLFSNAINSHDDASYRYLLSLFIEIDQYYRRENWEESNNIEYMNFIRLASNMYLHLGKYEEPKLLLNRILTFTEKYFDENSIQIADILDDLGSANFNNPPVAKSILERSLKIKEKLYGIDNIEVAGTLNMLGIVYGDLNEFNITKELTLRSLNIYKKTYGENHISTAGVKVNLAVVLSHLGDFNDQRNLIEEALPILENYYGKTNIMVAKAMSNLGDAYGALGNTYKQINLKKSSLSILEKNLEPNDFSIGLLLANLGLAYGRIGIFEMKKKLLERSLPAWEKFYGVNHVKVAEILYELAKTCVILGDLNYAKVLYERMLPLFQVEKDYNKVLSILHAQIHIYSLLGDNNMHIKTTEHYQEIKNKFPDAVDLMKNQLKLLHVPSVSKQSLKRSNRYKGMFFTGAIVVAAAAIYLKTEINDDSKTICPIM